MNATARLADIAASLETGGSLPDDHRAYLSSAFKNILSGTPPDAALGIKRKPGERSAGYIQRHERRNEILRAAADRFWLGTPPPEQARRIADAMSRYYGAGWKFDGPLDECPQRLIGTPREYFWRALKAVAVPVSAATIRRILR